MPDLDPILPLMRRSVSANNEVRAKLIATHALQQRRDPEAFEAYIRQMLEWAQAEAVAKDRAGAPMLITDRKPSEP